MSNKKLFDEVKEYMIRIRDEHIEPLTGEFNTTTLAEAAADEFNLYDEDSYPQDWLFDLAFYVYRDYCP